MFKLTSKISFVFFHYYLLVYAELQKPGVKVIDGTVLKEVHPALYEASWPMFYKLHIPNEIKLANERTKACEAKYVPNSIKLELHSLSFNESFFQCGLNEIFQSISNRIQEFHTNDTFNMNHREKRQLGIALAFVGGALFGPVITKVFKHFFGGSDEIESYVNQLRDSVEDNHKDILKIRDHVLKIDSIIRIQGEEIENLRGEMYQLLQDMHTLNTIMLLTYSKAVRYENQWETALDSCRSSLIPKNFVTATMLKKHIAELDTTIQKNGYQVSLPSGSLSSLFKLPIAECVLTDDSLFVIINIPLVSVGSHWRLYEVSHPQYASNGQTCQLYPSETSFVAQNGEKLMHLQGHHLQHCSVKKLGICHVPSYEKESKQSIHCAAATLAGSSLEDIRNSCTYQCLDNAELLIQQIDTNKLILTNADKVRINCNGNDKTYSFKRIGAVQLTLGCMCDVYVNEILQKRPFPCLKYQNISAVAIPILPLVMTNLTSSLTASTDLFIKHIDAAYNQDWSKDVVLNNISRTSDFNLTLSNFSLPDKYQEDGFFGRNNIWLYSLIVVTAVLVGERILFHILNCNSLPNTKPLLPVVYSAALPGASAFDGSSTEVFGLLTLLASLFTIFLIVWVLRGIRQLFTVYSAYHNTGIGYSRGIEAGLTYNCQSTEHSSVCIHGPSAPTTDESYRISSDMYLCIKRGGEFYAIRPTPLKKNTTVEFEST